MLILFRCKIFERRQNYLRISKPSVLIHQNNRYKKKLIPYFSLPLTSVHSKNTGAKNKQKNMLLSYATKLSLTKSLTTTTFHITSKIFTRGKKRLCTKSTGGRKKKRKRQTITTITLPLPLEYHYLGATMHMGNYNITRGKGRRTKECGV